jgi:hypothetical protein
MIWLSLTLLLLAAFFKAVADTLQHHYGSSVFSKLNKNWWNPVYSWQYVKFLPLTKYRADGWHLANSGMIICFIAVGVVHQPVLAWYWELLIGGAYFNLVFNLFYNKLLR